MPLRDHFQPPLSDYRAWSMLHAAWPTLIVMNLNRRLPPRYVAGPRVYSGRTYEIDIGTIERDDAGSFVAAHDTPDEGNDAGNGGGVATATAVWAPPMPALAVTTERPEQAEYEVLIFDRERAIESDRKEGRLVAAIEIVSPSNKDRPENRRAFAAKCTALLRQGVSVSVVDLVTARPSNLYGELLEFIGQTDPALTPEPPPLYATTCRWQPQGKSGRLETWTHPLKTGNPLPTLPLWLAADLAVPLELEATYEETCQVLRIA